MSADARIKHDIVEELQWDPNLDASGVGVTVRDGIVALTGHVASSGEKAAAERDAGRVSGVKAVVNEIEVRVRDARERVDTSIARAAIKALGWRVAVPEGRVRVTVSKGWITLAGEVDSHFQKAAAEEAVKRLHGVRGVLNLIRVKERAGVDDARAGTQPDRHRVGNAEPNRVLSPPHDQPESKARPYALNEAGDELPFQPPTLWPESL